MSEIADRISWSPEALARWEAWRAATAARIRAGLPAEPAPIVALETESSKHTGEA